MEDKSKTVERLILFTRYPMPGVTKTRLIPALGKEGAADLQRRMTEAVATQAEIVGVTRQLHFEICYDGGDPEQVKQWLAAVAPSGRCRPQEGDDLGQRMQLAFAQAFADGSQRVVLFGCDCPAMSSGIMNQAFEALHDHDMVIGPAVDGGYYLLGLAAPQPFLFNDMEWGDEAVMARTLERAEAAGLRFFLLESLVDVDRPEDLSHFDHHSYP
ncbi:MAG: TIGR04282 family arsenosugar biosynthesis glycosyltransferase [Desulfobulbaceae bacterium]|nr:TIGR04282 family arsenosugar biosynthesis glycosyltransferase [Desulfobulbaceae bacterium]